MSDHCVNFGKFEDDLTTRVNFGKQKPPPLDFAVELLVTISDQQSQKDRNFGISRDKNFRQMCIISEDLAINQQDNLSYV